MFYSWFISRWRVPFIFLCFHLAGDAIVPISGRIELDFLIVENDSMQLILVDCWFHILFILRKLFGLLLCVDGMKCLSYLYDILINILRYFFVPFLSWLFLWGNHSRIVICPLCCFQVQRIVEVALQFFTLFQLLLCPVEFVGVLKCDSDIVKRSVFFEEKRGVLRVFFNKFVR